MYACMYVEAPEGSKTVSVCLSTPTVHWAGGKRSPGHTASIPLTTKD